MNTFTYGNVSFKPIGRFYPGWDFYKVSRYIIDRPRVNDFFIGRIYRHADFYKASSDKEADVFLCIDTNEIVVPASSRFFSFIGEYEQI